jgi:hypothetical protein
MNTRGELLNSSRTNSEAKLKLWGKQKLRAQRQEKSILQRVRRSLEFVTDRRVRCLQ